MFSFATGVVVVVGCWILAVDVDGFSPTSSEHRLLVPTKNKKTNKHHHASSSSSSPILPAALSFSSLAAASRTTDDDDDDDRRRRRHRRRLVLEAMDELFPPQGLDQRIALSRKDGYWPFITTGDEPPPEFVYGEFDTAFFARILDQAGEILRRGGQSNTDGSSASAAASGSSAAASFEDWVFCDLGSGTGRLVLTAAALFPWKLCRGIELLEGIHEQAVEKLEACRIILQPEEQEESSSSSSSSAPSSGDEALQQANTLESSSSSSTTTTTTTITDSSSTSSSSSTSAYWKQYQQYSSSQPPKKDEDWLNDLAASFDDENKKDARSSGTMVVKDSQYFTTTTSRTSQREEDKTSENAVDDGDDDSDEQSYYALTHTASGQRLPFLAPRVDLQCGSFTDPYQFFGDANIVFVFSSAMPYPILVDLARAIGRQCQPGTLVLTTEYQLPEGGIIKPYSSEDDDDDEDDPNNNLPHGEYRLELLETVTGENESTGGESTVYIQRLVKSLGDGTRKTRKSPPSELSVSEIAYRVVKQLERDKLNNSKLFLRNVSNQMAFLGLPDSWRPKLQLDNDKDKDDQQTGARS